MADMNCDVVRNPSRNSDYISSLPEDILLVILSHIPTKSAIRTSVLSKRWKHVWHKTPSISIHWIIDCPRVDPTSIDETLRSFSSPRISSFSLDIGSNVTASQIDSWIELAQSRNVEKLSLKFFSSKYSFQDSFFSNTSMKQLTVTISRDMFPTCIVSWTSLRSLSLVFCKLSNESLANILAGCSMLESLKIHSYSRLLYLDLSKSVNLRKLEIIRRGQVEIVAPHIHYLSLQNIRDAITIVDVSSLTEANLNTVSNCSRGFDKADSDFLQDLLLNLLTKLQNVEKLTIGTILLQILSLAELRGVTFPRLKIKHLTIETKIFPYVIPGIVRLLQNSPGLKKITVHTKNIRVTLIQDLDNYLNTQGLNPDHCWSEKYGVFAMVDADSKHVASFIELVLQKAKTLETMVLRLKGYLRATEYQKLLSMVPTVSSRNTENVRKCGQGKAILKNFKITP